MRLRSPELQEEDRAARKIIEQVVMNSWQNIEGVLHRERFPYVPVIVKKELISRNYDNPLADYFHDKTIELIYQKYYWLSFSN